MILLNFCSQNIFSRIYYLFEIQKLDQNISVLGQQPGHWPSDHLLLSPSTRMNDKIKINNFVSIEFYYVGSMHWYEQNQRENQKRYSQKTTPIRKWWFAMMCPCDATYPSQRRQWQQPSRVGSPSDPTPMHHSGASGAHAQK